jgi:hypothetical protein
MGLLDQAQFDIKRITTDLNGFARTMTFLAPDNLQKATINGIHSKVHVSVDTEGNEVNAKKAHISFNESLLTDQGYTTRDSNGKCTLKDHKVSVIDSTGIEYQYIIRQVYPDETVGLIVCLLGDFEA